MENKKFATESVLKYHQTRLFSAHVAIFGLYGLLRKFGRAEKATDQCRISVQK